MNLEPHSYHGAMSKRNEVGSGDSKQRSKIYNQHIVPGFPLKTAELTGPARAILDQFMNF